MSEKWIEEISIETVPDKYKDLVNLIGVGNVLTLAQNYGGAMIYIPKYDSIAKDLRNEKIKSEFNGGNYKELMKKYNLSESQIRNIIKSETVDGQMLLYD